MALVEVQSALARLFTDEALRARFFADPVAVGRSLGLDEGEAASLAGLAPGRVARFAATLRRKRVDDARKYLPLTSLALGDAFASALRDAIDGPPPPGRHRDDARALADHLVGHGPGPEWAADLARYELAFREAMTRRAVLLVRRFRWDVGGVAEALHRGDDRPEATPRAVVGIWLRVPGRRGVVHRLVAWPSRRRDR